jgi:MarR family transcriptional regulator for hemolysin
MQRRCTFRQEHLMATDDQLRYDLTNALQPARRAWNQAATLALSASGISVSLATPVLFVSRLGDGVQQNVLATEIGVNPAAMVRTLALAEGAELLERRAVPGDRRAKGIYLLPKGARIAEKIEHELARVRRDTFGDIPTADIEIATRVLRHWERAARSYLARNASRPQSLRS